MLTSANAQMGADTCSDPELSGPPGLQWVQRELYSRRAELSALVGVFSQGRTVGFMEVHPPEVLSRIGAAGRPARVLLHVARADAEAVAGSMALLGYYVEPPFDLLIGSVDDIAREVAELCAKVPAGPFDVAWLGRDTPGDLVSALQLLQHANGITPIPGWVLRGNDGRTRTSVIVDVQGGIHGGVSMQQVQYRGMTAAMGFGLCISGASEGRGWARYLNARVIRKAAASGAAWFMEIVAPRSVASQRVNLACGLRTNEGECFLFAEALSSVDTKRLTS